MTDRDEIRSQESGPSDAELENAVPRGQGGREFRVGIFVIAGFVAFMVALFVLTDPASFRGRYMVVTTVDEAGGLRKGDPVQMRGVNIGRVHRFTMSDEGVAVTLEIEGEWDIPVDSRTELVSNGILGGRTVEVIPGEAAQSLREGAIIPGRAVEDVFSQADSIGGRVDDVLGRVQSLLDEPTVSSLQASAEELRGLLENLNAVTTAQRDEISLLIENLNAAASNLESVTGEEAQRVVARADSALVQLNETAGSLDRSARALETILGRMERGEGTLGRLSTDESLYRNLNRVAESLLALSEDLRANPNRYINLSLF